ncbi:MAG TPA: zinc-ribbon domain and TM2 domain-containing protein [Clostridia bacterium]
MPIEALKCPNCGAPLEHGQNFCDHCGIALKVTDDEPKEKPRGINISIDGKEKTYNYGFSFNSTPNYNTGNNYNPNNRDDGRNRNYTYGDFRPNDPSDFSRHSLSKDIALILALISLFFLCGIGIHKIYLKKIAGFVLSLLFVWTIIPLIVCFFNVISLATMSKESFYRKYC